MFADPEARLRADGSAFTVHLHEDTAVTGCQMYGCADGTNCCAPNIDVKNYANSMSGVFVREIETILNDLRRPFYEKKNCLRDMSDQSLTFFDIFHF